MLSILVGGMAGEATQVVELLSNQGHAVRVCASDELLAIHDETGADLVVLRLPLDGGATRAGALLKGLRAQDPRVPIVVAGRDADVDGAPAALALGATEYAAGDDAKDVAGAVALAAGARERDAQLRYLRSKDAAEAGWENLVGRSASMARVLSIVRHVCQRTASGGAPAILITGETGTGKGLLAKSIHYNSARRSSAMVEVNCAAIPASLIEAELFGHEKGAFTDARSARPGLFELAHGGTLFLDEIGAMPFELQPKLLTAIEEKVIRRIGGQHPVRVSVQVIAATHRELAAMAGRGEFREDLYHRLNVVSVELPPLREREEDAVLLAEAFLASMTRAYGLPPRRLTPAARAAILAYAWPGNIRELRNRIERLVLLSDGEDIQPEDLALPGGGKESELEIENDGALRVKLPREGFSLDGLEREVLRQTLAAHGGNVSRAARYLQISRYTLMYRLRKHNLVGSEHA